MSIIKNREVRYFSGYRILGLWNIENCTVVLFVSCPPDLKHQEDALVSQGKIHQTRWIFPWETREKEGGILLLMKQIVTSALYLLTIFSVSYFIFEPTHLYYELKWLDIPMHIMGGFGIASLTGALFAYFQKSVSFWKLLAVYTVVAFVWEFYEYIRDVVAYTDWNGWFDTIKDFVDGLIGMSIAYIFIKK